MVVLRVARDYQECEAVLTKVEAMNLDEDDVEGRDEAVQDAYKTMRSRRKAHIRETYRKRERHRHSSTLR